MFFDVFLEVVEGLFDLDLVVGVEYDVDGLTRIRGESTPTLPAYGVLGFVFAVVLSEFVELPEASDEVFPYFLCAKPS